MGAKLSLGLQTEFDNHEVAEMAVRDVITEILESTQDECVRIACEFSKVGITNGKITLSFMTFFNRVLGMRINVQDLVYKKLIHSYKKRLELMRRNGELETCTKSKNIIIFPLKYILINLICRI